MQGHTKKKKKKLTQIIYRSIEVENMIYFWPVSYIALYVV